MFGQYSIGGGLNRTKTDMLSHASGGIVWSRKAGKNRLHFKRADGSQGFILHETIVADLSPDGKLLRLDDGGWATPTTRTAFGDAVHAFGLPGLHIRSARPKADHSVGFGEILFDRRVTLAVTPDGYKPIALAPDPMIRAVIDEYGTSVEVHYCRDGHIRSTSGETIRATPFSILLALHKIDRLCRENRKRFTFRGEAQYDRAISLFGHEVYPGSGGRSVHIGCHVFKTRDIRAAMRRIEGEHPEAAKLAKAAFRKSRKKEIA